MNTIVLVGRLVADPSLRYTQTGPRTLDAERQRLIDCAMRYGLADERTIRQSQVVDKLVNVEQRRRYRWHKRQVLGI